MPGTPRHPVRHPLASLTEAAHLAAPHHGSSVVCLDLGPHDVAIGHWRVPDERRDPVESLIGVIAPPRWDAVGLTCQSRLRVLSTGHRTAAKTTLLVDRDASFAGVIDDGCGDVRIVSDAPAGVLADALLRVLGLPTPEPHVPLGYLVESAWLDAIAARAFGQPGKLRSWARVADLHPLATAERPGEPGVCLSVAVQALQTQSSWGRILQLWAPNIVRPRYQPPDMQVTPVEAWFDEGSFARWTLQPLPVAEDLLPAVLDALPDAIGAELLDALVTVGDGLEPGLGS